MAARKDGLYAVLGERSIPAVLKTAERNAPIVRIDYTALALMSKSKSGKLHIEF